MRSWMTALRLARREIRRARGRSALVVAMIMLPVLALSYAAVSYDMVTLTASEKVTQKLGAADAAVQLVATGTVLQDGVGESYDIKGEPRTEPATESEIRALLPAGSRIIRTEQRQIHLRTATGVGSLPAYAVDIADPLFRGKVTLLEGRAASGAGEVVITRSATTRLGVSIGDTLKSADQTRGWQVVGLAEFPEHLDESVLFPSATIDGTGAVLNGTVEWLVDSPAAIDWPQVLQLNELGLLVSSRAVRLSPPSPAETPLEWDDHLNDNGDTETLAVGALIVGLGVLEVILLAGPAFAVGARRRQRDLALVAANGGTAAQLRRIVLSDGVVLGVLGAIIGLLLGVALALVGRPLAEEHLLQMRAAGYRFYPLALVGIAMLAVVTGMLAAMVPAFTAARQDVVTALTGRRGVVRSRKRWLFAGVALVGLGAGITCYAALQANTNLILAGLVTGELGLVLCTPALVGLISRIGGALPLTPRMALRDTARNRAAAAPAISAVMAAVAGSVAIGIYLDSNEARQAQSYQPSLPSGYVAIPYATYEHNGSRTLAPAGPVRAAAEASLPVREVVEISEVTCPKAAPDTAQPTNRCGLIPIIPAEQQCPVNLTVRPLTAEQQRAAAEDKRCEMLVNEYYGYRAFPDVVGGRDQVAALTGISGAELEQAAATLAAGGLVTSQPEYVANGSATLEILTPDQKHAITEGDPSGATESYPSGAVLGGGEAGTTGKGRDTPTITVPAYVLQAGVERTGTILSPAAVAKAGLRTQVSGLVVVPERTPDQADEDRLAAALAAVNPTIYAFIERGAQTREDPILLILGLAAGLITLGAAGIATGLAAADGRADLSTLAAVGASPGVRRLLSLSQSGVIAGLGSLLGVLAGTGAAFAVLVAFNQANQDEWPAEPSFPLALPWANLAVVLTVPLIAMLGAGLLTRSRLPIERRRLT